MLNVDLILMLVMETPDDEEELTEDANQTSDAYLEVVNIHDGSSMLKLHFPFSQSPDVITMFKDELRNVTSSHNPDGLYGHDPTADQIALLRVKWYGSTTVCIVLSLSRILRLVSTTNGQEDLDWSDWGPPSTRWYHEAPFIQSLSICGSRIAMLTRSKELLDCTPREPGVFDDDTRRMVFLDFNQRVIRHQISHQERATSDIEDGPNNDVEVKTVTEEWTLRSNRFTQDIHSSLPFRIVGGRNFYRHALPYLGITHFTATNVGNVSLKPDALHFSLV